MIDEVTTHGGQGENGVIVTEEDEREEHLRGPPVVLGKHSACLYPWRQTLSGMRQRGVGRGGGGQH